MLRHYLILSEELGYVTDEPSWSWDASKARRFPTAQAAKDQNYARTLIVALDTPDPCERTIAQIEALLLSLPEERRGEALERFCRECLRVTDDRQCYCIRDD